MRIVDAIIPTLYEKNINKKILLMATVLNQLFLDQREKVLIGKHVAFSVEKSVVDKKHPNHKVATLFFQTSILNKCYEKADKRADDVLRWLSSSIDLLASDAIYHGKCESNFLTKKCIPTTKGTETEHTPGRRTDNAMKSNFEKLCE